MINVLMTGVDKKRLGGMWTVANNYITSEEYNSEVNLTYIATSTNGGIIKRVFIMLIAFIKIFFCLLTKKIEIVHIHMAERGSTFRARLISKISKIFNKKVIIHLHAGPFIDWYSSLNLKKKNKIKEMFNMVDCVLVLGEYWKKSLSKIVNIDKIKVLYNGVKIEENKYNVKGTNITYMGVLKKEKGIFDLIDAIKLINKELDEKYIVKLCGIDLVGNVNEYIESKGLKNRIILTGWVDYEEKQEILQNTILNILPSYYEALSMTVIESMAYGIPIITTDISTMMEVLDDKELLVEPGDVEKLAMIIKEMINNHDKLIKVSKKEYERCKKFFDVKSNIKKTLSIYKDI